MVLITVRCSRVRSHIVSGEQTKSEGMLHKNIILVESCLLVLEFFSPSRYVKGVSKREYRRNETVYVHFNIDLLLTRNSSVVLSVPRSARVRYDRVLVDPVILSNS